MINARKLMQDYSNGHDSDVASGTKSWLPNVDNAYIKVQNSFCTNIYCQLPNISDLTTYLIEIKISIYICIHLTFIGFHEAKYIIEYFS